MRIGCVSTPEKASGNMFVTKSLRLFLSLCDTLPFPDLIMLAHLPTCVIKLHYLLSGFGDNQLLEHVKVFSVSAHTRLK